MYFLVIRNIIKTQKSGPAGFYNTENDYASLFLQI